MPEPILDWGIVFVIWMQGLGDGLNTPMNVVTFTGDTLFFLFFLPVVYWSIDRRFALRVALAMLVSIAANSLLKMSFRAPRPYWYDDRVRLLGGGEALFGLPSGHAQNAVVMWGILAAQIGRWWAWIGAIVMMALAGVSRVYLGVHFPTDVLAGWLVGSLILFLFLHFEGPVGRWFAQFSVRTAISLLFVGSLLLIAVGALLAAPIGVGWQVPALWEANALAAGGPPLDGVSLQDTIASGATLFGIAAGAVWLRSLGNFNAGGPIGYRLLRYVVGVLGVALFYVGLDQIFSRLIATDESTLGLMLRYLRYALVGFWMIGLAPALFLRVGWAEVERAP